MCQYECFVTLSVLDLRKVLKEMGEEVDERQLRDLIAEVDINKNNTIEQEEFLQVCYNCTVSISSFLPPSLLHTLFPPSLFHPSSLLHTPPIMCLSTALSVCS